MDYKSEVVIINNKPITIYEWDEISHNFKLEDYPEGIIIKNMPNEKYHSMEGISSSVLKHFLPEKSPYKWYYERYVDKKKEHNSNFAFGTASHEYILEFESEEKFLENNAVLNYKSFWGAQAEQDLEKNLKAGKNVILKKEYEDIKKMKDVIKQHDFALGCFNNSYSELSFFAKHPEYGVWIKARPDSISKDFTTFNDYKTCRDSSPYGSKKAIVDYNYDVSASWYINIIEILTGVKNQNFYWIFQQKTVPFLVNVSMATEIDLVNGFELCELALSNFMQCKETGYYPHWLNDRGEPAENIHVAYLPEYYRFKVDKQLGRLD